MHSLRRGRVLILMMVTVALAWEAPASAHHEPEPGSLATLHASPATGYKNTFVLNGQGYSSSATASRVTIHMNTRSGRVIASFRQRWALEPEPIPIPCDIARDNPGVHTLIAMQYDDAGNLISGLPGRASVVLEAVAAAACISAPATITTQPLTAQTIYRIWGGDAKEFGSSWTPIDPRFYGPEQFRERAGLPDRLNSGKMGTMAQLDNPFRVSVVRGSLTVNPTMDYGLAAYQSSGVAYREYGGGLQEYVIPDAQRHALFPARQSFSEAPYGGVPPGCDPAPRGCVGE